MAPGLPSDQQPAHPAQQHASSLYTRHEVHEVNGGGCTQHGCMPCCWSMCTARMCAPAVPAVCLVPPAVLPPCPASLAGLQPAVPWRLQGQLPAAPPQQLLPRQPCMAGSTGKVKRILSCQDGDSTHPEDHCWTFAAAPVLAGLHARHTGQSRADAHTVLQDHRHTLSRTRCSAGIWKTVCQLKTPGRHVQQLHLLHCSLQLGST